MENVISVFIWCLYAVLVAFAFVAFVAPAWWARKTNHPMTNAITMCVVLALVFPPLWIVAAILACATSRK